jgi:hypothetical protein
MHGMDCALDASIQRSQRLLHNIATLSQRCEALLDCEGQKIYELSQLGYFLKQVRCNLVVIFSVDNSYP